MENQTEFLEHLFLITYERQPAAMVWAIPGEQVVLYPLRVGVQSSFFRVEADLLGQLPASAEPIEKIEKFLLQKFSPPQGEWPHLRVFNVLEDPHFEYKFTEEMAAVSADDHPGQGIRFVGSYSPWDGPTERFI